MPQSPPGHRVRGKNAVGASGGKALARQRFCLSELKSKHPCQMKSRVVAVLCARAAALCALLGDRVRVPGDLEVTHSAYFHSGLPAKGAASQLSKMVFLEKRNPVWICDSLGPHRRKLYVSLLADP